MSRPWRDIDPEEEKLLAQWNRDTVPSMQGCLSAEMVRASLEECLPEPELSRAKQHLEQCAVCSTLAKDLQTLEMAGPTALEDRRMRAKIGLPVEAVVVPKRPWWSIAAPWVLAAGCAVLAIGIWTRLSQPVGKGAANVAKSEPPRRMPVQAAAVRMPLASLVWRGEENKDPYPAALGKAFEAYREARYTEAIRELETVTAKFPGRAEGHFYLGVSLLMEGRDAEAIAPMERAKTMGESPVRAEVDWYLAAALRNASRGDEARALFRAVCEKPGTHQKEACTALADQ